ncbi:MAG: hypothetical protein ACJAU2_001169 [Maribacter sp.]|jgi:hypothetical protein
MVLRVLLGLFVIVFGLNKIFDFVPFGGVSKAFANYMAILGNGIAMYLIGAVEIIAGLPFIFNEYGVLLALILMSVSINAFVAHTTFELLVLQESLSYYY